MDILKLTGKLQQAWQGMSLQRATFSYQATSTGSSYYGTSSQGSYADQEAAGGKRVQKELPCRVLVKARGVQWFIYNRSPAYDAILERLREGQTFRGCEDVVQEPEIPVSQNKAPLSKDEGDIGCIDDSQESESAKLNLDGDDKDSGFTPTRQSTNSSSDASNGQEASLPGILGILPIKIECNKGAIVMGNNATLSILTATFESASGTITAHAARPLDQYKQSIDFNFVHPIIQFKHNKDYQCSHIERGKKVKSNVGHDQRESTPWHEGFNLGQQIVKLLRNVRSVVLFHQDLGSVESFSHHRQVKKGTPETTRDEPDPYGTSRWVGLSRYLDHNDASVEQERWKAIEYAQFPTIVDSPSISMSFYWDVPGEVQSPPESSRNEQSKYAADINGEVPPDWGIDLRVKGGTINYGPWADRQRADLQAVFFPTLYMDSRPGNPLSPGQTRVSTELKMTIIIEEQTTLRIPTREDSKDWKWKGHVPPADKDDNKNKKAKSGKKGHKGQRADADPESRPFGWLDVDVFADSTVNFTMDLVAKKGGFKNLVNLELKGLELSSSVNHAVLLKSKSQIISCDLAYPITWNTLRRWNIESEAESVELFILRDHIFLITDLVDDWASGPPADFHAFVPFIYTLSLRFRDFRFYVNANESNVIDNPAAIDDNTFVVIYAQELVAGLSIPMESFRPAKNTVTFDVETRDGGFELITPPWNTLHTLLDSPHVAALKDMKIDGSYNFHTSTSPALTDILQVDIYAVSLKVELYGFLIRYLMKIKDNYFGEDIHFRTVEEYQQLVGQPHHGASESEQRIRLSNDLDVIIGITVLDSYAQLPSRLYSALEGVTLEVPSLQVDLRVTNYYMDLAVTSSPIGISKGSWKTNSPLALGKGSATQLSLNFVQIYGHRLFGLPPAEPTYVCNWDFDVGQIEGDCSIHFLNNLAQAITCFGLTFPDAENAVPSQNASVVPDVTFLRARLQPIRIGMRIEQTALLLESEDINIQFDDWAGSKFSDHFSAVLPNISVSLVDTTGTISTETSNLRFAKTFACFQTAIDIHSVSSKQAFAEEREHQQRHIALHDLRTQRTPWLLLPSTQLQFRPASVTPAKVRPPAMSFPPMPAPVSGYGISKYRTTSLPSATTTSTDLHHKPIRKSSFLSTSSVMNKSEHRRQTSEAKIKISQGGTSYQVDRKASVSHASDKTAGEGETIPYVKEKERFRPADLNMQRTSSHLGFAFTSPYKKPYFPVLAMRPDTQQVPRRPQNFLTHDPENGGYPPDEDTADLHPGSSQSSLMLNFKNGIRFYCTPRSLFVATKLQEEFQARDPEILLDSLQIDSMSQLLRDGANRERGSNVRNLRLHLPFVELRFVNDLTATPHMSSRQERYELSLENLTASLRFSDLVSQDTTHKIDHEISAHMAFNRLECSAREFTEGHKGDQAVVGISLLQPVFWMNSSATLSGDLQFQDFEIVSASRKVDHVSSLVRQTIYLVEALVHRFSRTVSSQKSRLALLVLLLTKEGEDIPDPPFLTGASYVLRSATNHLRTTDSWKMMSRLRHVSRELSNDSKEKIRNSCAERFVSCPADGGAYVVKTFDHWRTWDLAHVKSSILMQKVFGDLLLSPAERASRLGPSKLSLKAGRFRILIDPGPHQNEVVVTRAVINTALCQERKASTEPHHSGKANSMDSMVQVYLAHMALRLNWALCELVESIVRTIQDASEQKYTETKQLAQVPASTAPKESTNWQFVVCVGMAIVNLDTLALKVISLCQGLRSSLVFVGAGNADISGLVSMAICADAATSEFRSHTNALTLYKLQRPSVVGSRDGHVETGVEKPWRFVGSGKEVTFEVLASLLEILEVADQFVQNELCIIHSWAQSIQSRGSQLKSPSDPSTVHKGLPKAHVTLFLDAYFLSVAVLPTLIYQIHGTGGRTSIKSGLRGDLRVDLDVDVRDHSHAFRGGMKQGAIEISSLHIPPINGRLILDLAPQQKSVVLRALTEPIMFEASAIHSMITAINRPEIVNIVQGTSDQIKLIQSHVPQTPDTKILNPSKEVEASKTARPLLYDSYITLAGFSIHASTPDARSEDDEARLEFNMGRIQVKAANNELGKQETLKHSEIEARLDTIRLRLIRTMAKQSVPCGEVAVGVVLQRTSKINGLGKRVPSYQIKISSPKVSIYTETASVIVAIAGHLQDTLKTIEVSEEVKNLGRLGYARLRSDAGISPEAKPVLSDRDPISEALMNAIYSLELTNIRIIWHVEDSASTSPGRALEDLVLSFTKINLATKRENAARLTIQDLQLQMVPHSGAMEVRSANSALLPEIVFNVAYLSTANDRRFAFQAKGKALDLRLTSQFISPASYIRRSIALATEQVRAATESWYAATPGPTSKKRMNPLNSKRLGSVLVAADFAGAVLYISGQSVSDPQSVALKPLQSSRRPQHGRYNQFTPDDAASHATLRAPGFAFKADYKNTDGAEPYLNAEIKVEASSNTLYPTVVPLIMEISSSVKEAVSDSDQQEASQQAKESKSSPPRFFEDERLKNPDPVAIFGDVRLNFGLRICRQEFSLSCQPIARVAATAYFDDIYVTVNTVRSDSHGKFFSISAAVSRLKVNLQHVYSRESTCGFQLDSIVLSLMNSRHVSKANGISAILKLSPTKVQINAKQSQDFLLFREIWVPNEIRHSPTTTELTPTTEPQAFIVQRYQQVAAAGAFPWNATVSVEELDVELDLGQSLGKSSLIISHFWISSRKSSDWEQNMCLGFDKVSVDSTGRTSGTIEMNDFKVRTSIQWPIVDDAHNQTPLIQASLGFDQLCVKGGFDYQPFIIAHVKNFEFLMYNVRDAERSTRDRLVGILDAHQLQLFLTTTSASQAIALYQAVQKLIQEKQAAYDMSLRDIEKYLRRKSSVVPFAFRPSTPKVQSETQIEIPTNSLKLQTDVVVTLRTVNIGAFPSTFFDQQIFKVEALDASARFAVVLENERIHSTLGLILGQLRVALSAVSSPSIPKTLGEVQVKDVVDAAMGSRGGTILKVPKLIATMETWQSPESTAIDYIFKSSFQGKVDVGWNYSRISYIRGMYNGHERALAQRLGKEMPQPAVQITGLEDESEGRKMSGSGQEKITAVVNVPQSKFQYTALQPPIIETPQLRDMGEATPPLEWIGLHRDRLPNLTHQIVIVTLLQLAGEVDGAYTRILGSS